MKVSGITLAPGSVIRFRYTNWQMETEERRAPIDHFWYGSSTFHTGELWFVCAWCFARKDGATLRCAT